jgi:lysophospholipase L1-like esterase
MGKTLFLANLFYLLAASTATAQDTRNTSVPVGIVDHPCPPAISMPAGAAELLSALFMEPRALSAEDFAQLNTNKAFADYLAAVNANTIQDWPGLCRFRVDNDALISAGVKPQVVFMGDSITENWLLGDPDLFGTDMVNRGISAQTTPQMLLRFRNDVVDLNPEVVHILAGTNDIAGNTGPIRAEDFKNNIRSMVELAKANGIQVILGSIPPAASFSWQPAVNPVPRVRELNGWLQNFAAEKDLAYIDYFAALSGPGAELRSELGNDGVHPNRDGYVIMRQLLEAQLAAMAN